MQTQAIVLVNNGNAATAFQERTITIQELNDNEVRIEVEAFGLNYADVLARNGMYKEAPPMPCVLGYEVVGKIVAVGKAVDGALINKRVLAFCRFGGYAKHVNTLETAIVIIEEQEDAAHLLALCTQAVTAYYMTDYLAPIHKGDHVLIHAAAGGVGSFLIQLAKRKGAIVYAKIGDDSKIELVKNLGADFVINYKKTAYEETLKSLLKTDRLSASYNAVAGSTFKKDVALLGSGGKLFLFGGAEIIGTRFGIFSTLNFIRKMGFILPIGLMMRSKSILGVNMLKIADNRPDSLTECLAAVIDLYRKNELKTHVGGRFSVKEIAQAHTLLQAGKTTGKLSVFWED